MFDNLDVKVSKKEIECFRNDKKLSEEECNLYLKDISTSLLLFCFKSLAGMAISPVSFFEDFYLPSNSKMKRFSEEDARYVFEVCIASFYTFTQELTQFDEYKFLNPKLINNDIII